MNRFAAAALAVFTAACGVEKGDEFRQGIPKSEAVTLKLPGMSASGLSGGSTRSDGLEGQKADLYVMTRGVTAMVNGGGAAVLAMVSTIVNHPATSVNGDTAVWGPHTDALSPNTYRFTVKRTSPDHFDYKLEGRGKNEADSTFRAILVGSHVVTGQALGAGGFVLSFDQAATLPEHNDDVGSATYVYAHPTGNAPIQIGALFKQVKDRDTGKLTDVQYAYQANPGQGGAFEFKMSKDLATGAALETASAKSRWNQTGEGRCDLKAAGGNLTAEATASECWDQNFASTYLAASFSPAGGWGQASTCAFSSPEFPSVSP